jgi:hypothetical protein
MMTTTAAASDVEAPCDRIPVSASLKSKELEKVCERVCALVLCVGRFFRQGERDSL